MLLQANVNLSQQGTGRAYIARPFNFPIARLLNYQLSGRQLARSRVWIRRLARLFLLHLFQLL
jgi:hypothetical protein